MEAFWITSAFWWTQDKIEPHLKKFKSVRLHQLPVSTAIIYIFWPLVESSRIWKLILNLGKGVLWSSISEWINIKWFYVDTSLVLITELLPHFFFKDTVTIFYLISRKQIYCHALFIYSQDFTCWKIPTPNILCCHSIQILCSICRTPFRFCPFSSAISAIPIPINAIRDSKQTGPRPQLRKFKGQPRIKLIFLDPSPLLFLIK